MKIVFLIFCTSFFSLNLFSQEKVEVKDTVKHSVKKAVILSTIVPGAGQIYNHLAMPRGKKRAFLKVPLIYAGLGGTGYMILKNNQLQKELKNEYNQRIAGNDGLEIYQQYDDQGIITLYNQHLNRRDLFILGFSLVYIIQVVDAAVEAHFVTFDISEDLTLNISPTMLGVNQAGIRLSLAIK
ncbi:MAG: DUF5683 domain-containing protein [Bacteroidota bacterium]